MVLHTVVLVLVTLGKVIDMGPVKPLNSQRVTTDTNGFFSHLYGGGNSLPTDSPM